MSSQTDILDVVVIGAGLAGTCLASYLVASGRSVALIDAHAVHPRDFRAEKYGAAQMALFERLGLGPATRACTTETGEVRVVRFGGPSYAERSQEYGAAYPVLVNALREQLPPGLLTVGPRQRPRTQPGDAGGHAGRRAPVRGPPHRPGDRPRRGAAPQGRGVQGGPRPVPLPGDRLRHGAAARRLPIRGAHLFRRGVGGRDAYLTLFPLEDTMRANLFCYREPAEPWTKAFRADPEGSLRALMPGLAAHCPDLRIAGPVEVRPIDLARAAGHERDGLVLVGDAFQTACPIPGTGIGKALTDVERLARFHLPDWLATPGMARDKIATYYADPVKRASDAKSLRTSLYARAINTETSLPWAARRLRNRLGRYAIRVSREAGRAAARAASSLTLPFVG